VFGESHGKAIGVVINGFPAGEVVNIDELQKFLARRAPGQSALSTARKEPDIPQFLSGIKDDIIGGTPICAVITNTDQRSRDYEAMRYTPRPGHADFGAFERFSGHADMRGGGHFSGRLTAPLCVAGGIAKQILARQNIEITARIKSIGGVVAQKPQCEPTPQMKERILEAKSQGDSVGGIVECEINGIKAGVGGLMFESLESKIAAMIFAIPAIKGIEFGNGFAAAALIGSENNDEFVFNKEIVSTKTNNHGGILGGLTTGMPIVFSVAVKPTPSIAKTQDTINLDTKQAVKLSIDGRHDPCIVPRILPCIESAAAIVALDTIDN